MYVVIAGAGKVGWNLARELISKGHEVTVIESERSRYLTVEQELEHAIQYGDATELWVLERAGIGPHLGAVVYGEDVKRHKPAPDPYLLAAARLGGLAIAMVTIALPIVGVPLAKRLSTFTGGSEGTSARVVEALREL